MDWNIEQRHIGPLRVTVVDPPGHPAPTLAIVLCHGFGASGTDLVGLGPELFDRLGEAARGIRFYFPAAPLSLASQGMPGGRAWWPLDLELLQLAAEGKLTRDQSDSVPKGMLEAADLLRRTVDALLEECGLDTNRLVLGGFSQGAMVATEVSLTLPDPPAGLLIFSGTLLCESRWRELIAKRGPLNVMQSHGFRDPILPFGIAERLRDLLAPTGGNVTFVPFDGPHTIPESALEAATALLRNLAESA